MNKKVRLQKILADCGVASRRKSEELISKGLVKVNGVIAQIGDKVDPQKDKIVVQDKNIISSNLNKNRYIIINKPRGYITTMSDEKGRKCIADLVSDIPERVYPVGRLDKDSEGLLIMTNDGEFANSITHPSKHVTKTYRVTVKPGISEEQMYKIRVGIDIDGKTTAPAEVKLISEYPERAIIEIILKEGRNRQIRRMCDYLGIEVARLKRISVGTIKLGMLKPGRWRDLTDEELKKLTNFI